MQEKITLLDIHLSTLNEIPQSADTLQKTIRISIIPVKIEIK